VVVPHRGATGTTWIAVGRGRYDRHWSDPEGVELIATGDGQLRQRRLFVDDATWAGHYAETANRFFWPLLHFVRSDLAAATGYFPAPQTPSEAAWASYERVNATFAAAALRERAKTAWVHDYQLGLVPRLLREGGFGGRIGVFLHTPLPRADVALPLLDAAGVERLRQWLAGMLGADLVGVQTRGDAARLRLLVAALLDCEHDASGFTVRGRRVRTGVFPVGVDAVEIEREAETAPVPPAALELRARGLPLVVGLERLDLTKGIPERLAAVATAFERGERFAYFGVTAPHRPGVGGYERLDTAVDAASARAEDAAARAGGAAVLCREALAWPDVLGLLRAADVVFTSSLADGMNLVPLQAVAAQASLPEAARAVVISGRDTGTAAIFGGTGADGLVVVDPFDSEAMVGALRGAIRGEPGRISASLVEAVRRRDVYAWARSFRETLERERF
jgi:trehalose-6-phosphate synthase